MGFEFKGMDKLTKQLKQVEKQAKKAVDGEISLKELFNEEFMMKNTEAASFESFIDACPVKEDIEEVDQLDTPEMDEYVREQTEFESWSDLLQAATNNYAAEMLKNAGFKLG